MVVYQQILYLISFYDIIIQAFLYFFLVIKRFIKLKTLFQIFAYSEENIQIGINFICLQIFRRSRSQQTLYKRSFRQSIININNFIRFFQSLMDKAIIKHSLLQQPFYIPMKIRKQLPIQKNIFQLNEKQIKKSLPPQIPIQQQNCLVDPLIMDSTSIKSLLFSKMQSYLIFLSIIVSGLIVYKHQMYQFQTNNRDGGKVGSGEYYSGGNSGNDNTNYYSVGDDNTGYHYNQITQPKFYLLLLSSFITILLILVNIIGCYFQIKSNQIRGIQTHITKKILKILFFSLHPNLYTLQFNYLLHLVLVARLPYLFQYIIKSTIYYSNRSFRLTQIYGIKSTEIFMFSIKSILQEMKIKSIVIIYCLMVFVFTHCLYLGGLNEEKVKPFSTCFQIVIVTLPTIGYGEYSMDNVIQRIIILFAVVIGACLNSLITLIMLKQFQMSSQQTYAYNLLHKLNLKQKMENISRQYIVNTMHDLKQTNFNREYMSSKTESRKELDNRFKQEYKFLKTRYTQICAIDLNSMFGLFKQQLSNFKVGCQQMNNMIFVLLSKLRREKHLKRVQIVRKKEKSLNVKNYQSKEHFQ